jgi:two-component system chemotaxis sensor kinase CheA
MRPLAPPRTGFRSSHPSRPPPQPGEDDEGEGFLRVAAGTVDGFLEKLERVDLVHSDLATAAATAHQVALRLREVRSHLFEALRSIGPPQPWGVPQSALQRIETAARSVGSAAESLERGGLMLRRNAELLHTRASDMRGELAALRRTSVGWIFSRMAHAVERLALQEGKLVEVEQSGSEISIDRRMAERLLDPLMQLARNAVAHGIQAPDERARSGKPAVGRVKLRAERMGDWLRIIVEDDGRGVDTDHVRELAVARGAVAPATAQSAEPDELLPLLFLPGLTTREDADLLAGRGVGLELAQDATRRLGGAIRLQTRPEGGLRATLDVPSERGVVEVLWLEVAGQQFALPVSFTGRVEAVGERPLVHLGRCLGLDVDGPASLSLELVIQGVQPIAVGVDAIGEVEETIVRPLPPLVGLAGPYTGAILRSDGALRLALDAALLAARAWTHDA